MEAALPARAWLVPLQARGELLGNGCSGKLGMQTVGLRPHQPGLCRAWPCSPWLLPHRSCVTQSHQEAKARAPDLPVKIIYSTPYRMSRHGHPTVSDL